MTAPTPAEAEAKLEAAMALHCAVAFAADCRVAARVTVISPEGGCTILYDFVVLSPGERPPGRDGWEIYENHGGTAVRRSA